MGIGVSSPFGTWSVIFAAIPYFSKSFIKHRFMTAPIMSTELRLKEPQASGSDNSYDDLGKIYLLCLPSSFLSVLTLNKLFFQFPKDAGFDLTLEGHWIWKGRIEKRDSDSRI